MHSAARSPLHHLALRESKVRSETTLSILLLCLHLERTSTSSTSCRRAAMLVWVSLTTTLLKRRRRSSRRREEVPQQVAGKQYPPQDLLAVGARPQFNLSRKHSRALLIGRRRRGVGTRSGIRTRAAAGLQVARTRLQRLKARRQMMPGVLLRTLLVWVEEEFKRLLRAQVAGKLGDVVDSRSERHEGHERIQ